MNSNSEPEEKSKVNEITNAEMKKRIQKSLVILIVGIILLIIGIILLFIALYLWYFYFQIGGLPWSTTFWNICLTALSTILIIIGLILVIIGRKMRRKKSKVNEITDLKMEKKYEKSLAIFIVGLAIILIWVVLIGFRVLFLFQLQTIALMILGIIISLYGLYAVIVNKSQLDWQRRIILRRIFSGSIVLIIGVIFLSIALWLLAIQIIYPGAMWGLGYYGSVFFMIWGTILIILGLRKSYIATRSYLAERKKSNYSPPSKSVR